MGDVREVLVLSIILILVSFFLKEDSKLYKAFKGDNKNELDELLELYKELYNKERKEKEKIMSKYYRDEDEDEQ